MTQQRRPPATPTDIRSFPVDTRERHEMIVDLLGQHMVWLRNWAIEICRNTVENPAAAVEAIGPIRWKRFSGVADLTPEQRSAAVRMTEAGIDTFLRLFLTMISGPYPSTVIGPDIGLAFRLDVEAIRLQDHTVLFSESANRDGEKFFADYLQRWLNQYGASTPTAEPRPQSGQTFHPLPDP